MNGARDAAGHLRGCIQERTLRRTDDSKRSHIHVLPASPGPAGPETSSRSDVEKIERHPCRSRRRNLPAYFLLPVAKRAARWQGFNNKWIGHYKNLITILPLQ